MIGGYTVFDDDVAALDLIMAAWSSSGSYGQRVSQLQTGVGSAGPLTVRLAAAGPSRTVFDDDAKDDLRGEQDRDRFFADVDAALADNDKSDRQNGEQPDPLQP